MPGRRADVAQPQTTRCVCRSGPYLSPQHTAPSAIRSGFTCTDLHRFLLVSTSQDTTTCLHRLVYHTKHYLVDVYRLYALLRTRLKTNSVQFRQRTNTWEHLGPMAAGAAAVLTTWQPMWERTWRQPIRFAIYLRANKLVSHHTEFNEKRELESNKNSFVSCVFSTGKTSYFTVASAEQAAL